MNAARTKRRTHLLRVALALALAGFGAQGCARRQPSGAELLAQRQDRLREVDARLERVSAGYVYLAGDSYMALYNPDPLPCGREVVNGGLGGARAGDYLGVLDQVRFRRPPASILLSVGLNDLRKDAKTGSSVTSVRHFQANADALIQRLGATGAHVVVIAIPPVPARTARHFDLRAAGAFNQALRDICARRGCTVRDVFAGARDVEPWRARAGTPSDGLHLSDLAGYYRSALPDLCR